MNTQDVHEPNNSKPTPGWASLHLWHMQPIRDVLVGLGVFALILIAQKASVVTVPLLLAILLAYLFEPVIGWLMKKFSITRRSAVISIIVGVVTFVIIPAFLGSTYAAGQLVSFGADTFENIEHVQNANDPGKVYPQHADEYIKNNTTGPWPWLYEQIKLSRTEGSRIGDAGNAAIEWVTDNSDQVALTAAGVSVGAANTILGLIGALFGLGFMLFITAFFFFFTATEWIGLQQFGSNLLPDKNRETIIDLMTKFDRVISGFIRGRLTIAFIQSIIFSIGFFLIGVPGAFILGPVIAVLSIVPYLALIGVPIAVSLLWLQGHTGFRGEIWWVICAPVALYFIGQALDDYVLTPKIQGKSTGMDTPTILFASLAGGALFGIFGMLIAIPIAACVKILIQEVFFPKFKDWAEGRAADPLPIDN